MAQPRRSDGVHTEARASGVRASTPSLSGPTSAELVADQATVDAAQANVTAAQQNLAQGTVVSPIDGTVVTARPEELMSPDYWAQQVRETVRFHQGIQTLERQGVDAFLELGPQGMLSALVHEALSDAARDRASSARRG